MYRLGRFNSSASRPRPILVQLRTVWDKRIILNSCQKLKRYEERVFMAPDEPVEQRRKSTLERLKYQAHCERETVDVTNGLLFIEGSAAFHMSGYIRNEHGV
jgi:hypothetical protein